MRIPRKGFSLIEVLITIGIGLVIFTGAVGVTVGFVRNRQLDETVEVAVSYLRSAAVRSIQGEGNSSHGVSIAGGYVVLFRGASYAGREAAYDVVWNRPDYVVASGLGEVVFSKQAGLPSASGNIVFSNGARTITITVHPTGAISQQ